MAVSREDKKVEALARMKMLGIFPQTIRQFERNDLVSISEPPFGAFYWAEGEDLERIKSFEANYDALVYVVVRSFTTIGEMDSFLYVSDYSEEWDMDRKALASGETVAYVYNHDAPDCSELGFIGVKGTIAAGLERTW